MICSGTSSDTGGGRGTVAHLQLGLLPVDLNRAAVALLRWVASSLERHIQYGYRYKDKSGMAGSEQTSFSGSDMVGNVGRRG